MKQPKIDQTGRKIQQKHANYTAAAIIRVFVSGAMLIYCMSEVTASEPDLSIDSTSRIACITLGRTLFFLASLSFPISIAYIIIKENSLDLINLVTTILVAIAVELQIIAHGYPIIAQWISAFLSRAFG